MSLKRTLLIPLCAMTMSANAATLAQSGCKHDEPWGISEYRIVDQGFEHMALVADMDPQLARLIPTDVRPTLCAVKHHALVYVLPDLGVFQVDRHIDGSSEPRWLDPVPEHYGSSSLLVIKNQNLYLRTGDDVTRINIEWDVRNDPIPTILPSEELGFTQSVNSPVSMNGTVYAQSNDGDYWEIKNGLKPVAPPDVMVVDQRLRIGTTEGSITMELPHPVDGACHDGESIVAFGQNGRLTRLRVEGSMVSELGQFTLSGSAEACVVDQSSQRLYVQTNELVLWVFDLSGPGLDMPRAVTTDQASESFSGVTIHDSGFVVTQSLGDHTFLLFRAEDMRLAGRFRVAADVPRGLDGVNNTGGFAISPASSRYPEGALIVHDQVNSLPEAADNLKLIDWRDIQTLLID